MVFLVVLLRTVKWPGQFDLRHDRKLEPSRLVERLFGPFRLLELLLGCAENGRAVLLAHVPSLAIQAGRVVDLPEQLEELVIGHLRWIEGHPYRFGVACPASADLFVARVGSGPARVSRFGRGDTGYIQEGAFDPPETTGREYRNFEHCNLLVSITIIALDCSP